MAHRPQFRRRLVIAIGTLGLGLALGPVMATASAPQATRPLALRDLFAFREVESPAISPDGTHVAFVLVALDEEGNRERREIWLAPADGVRTPRRLTNPTWDATNPVWSPDGDLLGFTSSRDDGDGNAWFLDLRTGGEAFQIRGVDGPPIFSPDGRWIAFTRATAPTGEAAVRGSSRRYAVNEAFERSVGERAAARAHEWMGYRFDRRGYLPDPRDPAASPGRELFVVPRSGGEARRLTRMGLDVTDVAWAPDSMRLAFAADPAQRDEHSYERHDLWEAAVDGTTLRITEDDWVNRSPVWSSDGETLYFRRQRGLDALIASGADRGAPVDVHAIARDGSGLRNLTPTWDLIPRELIAAPAGRAVRFTAETRGASHLFELAPDGGPPMRITDGARRLGAFTATPDGRWMTYVAETGSRPSDVYVAAADGSAETRATAFNDRLLADLALADIRPLRYASTDGVSVEGWIALPPGYRRDGGVRYPLIVAIHGGPHAAYGESFSFQLQLWAAEGYAVLYTNPRGSTGYGEDFLWATWGGWGNRDGQDVMSGVAYALENYALDPERLGVAGYSYGGFLTNWLITHTDRFRAAVSGAGISNWLSDYGTADIPRTKESEFFGPPWQAEPGALLWEQSPIKHALGVSTPTLFVHGEADFRVPIEQAEQMYTALQKQDVPARFVRYADTSHGGWRPWDRAHRYLEEVRWWRRYLSGPGSGSERRTAQRPEL